MRKILIGLALCMGLGLLMTQVASAFPSAEIDVIYDGESEGEGTDWDVGGYIPTFVFGNEYTGGINAWGLPGSLGGYPDYVSAAIYIDWTHEVNDPAGWGWWGRWIKPVWHYADSVELDEDDNSWTAKWNFKAGDGLDGPDDWVEGETTALVIVEGADYPLDYLEDVPAPLALLFADEYIIYDINQITPEPTTMLLLGSGLLGLAAIRRRRKT